MITAFGGGILLVAVALELVPEADAGAGPGLTAAGLLAGTLAYVGIDAWLTRAPSARDMRRSAHAAAAGRSMDMQTLSLHSSVRESGVKRKGLAEHTEAARGESIAAGLVVDGIPESIALGLTVAEGEIGVALLAGVLIGNIVEAYGAAQPIIVGGHTRRFAVGLMAAIGAALAVATILGGTVLTTAADSVIGTAQAVAAGAILAVISVSIVPHAFAEVSSRVAVASVAGFIVGYLLS
jgi:ZIP family zinc transporter